MGKRIVLALLVFCIMVLPVFAGGSSAPVQEDATELRIMIYGVGMAPTNENIINRELERRTGFKLLWDPKPSVGYAQAVTTVLASGDYPDAMEWQGVYPTGIQELADDGIIRPLDDLIAQYGPEFTSAVRPDYSCFTSATDGKRYGIASRFFDYGKNDGILMRKDWLDKLGLQIPKNSDEYFNVLTAFKQNAEQLVGPNKRFIPNGTWTPKIQNTFLSYLMTENGILDSWNRVDGKLVYFINMPAYKTALQTARKFYQAGLIEPEFPIMASNDEYMNRIARNQYGCWDWNVDQYDEVTSTWAAQLYTALPELKGNLVFVPYFPNKNGVVRYQQTFLPGMQQVIFKETSEAKAINLMKLYNFMISEEGFFLTSLGIEGEHYTVDNGGKVNIKTLTADEKAKLGFWNYRWAMLRSYIPIGTSDYIRGLMQNEFRLEQAVLPPIAYGNAQTQYGVALTSLQTQYTLDLITKSDINFDAVFNDFVNTWNSSGGAQLTQEMNELYPNR